jgi:hypothetical protein
MFLFPALSVKGVFAARESRSTLQDPVGRVWATAQLMSLVLSHPSISRKHHESAMNRARGRVCYSFCHLLDNLGKALEGVLALHLAEHRKQRTETTRTVAILTGEPSLPPPKKVARSSAKREERLA